MKMSLWIIYKNFYSINARPRKWPSDLHSWRQCQLYRIWIDKHFIMVFITFMNYCASYICSREFCWGATVLTCCIILAISERRLKACGKPWSSKFHGTINDYFWMSYVQEESFFFLTPSSNCRQPFENINQF